MGIGPLGQNGQGALKLATAENKCDSGTAIIHLLDTADKIAREITMNSGLVTCSVVRVSSWFVANRMYDILSSYHEYDFLSLYLFYVQ